MWNVKFQVGCEKRERDIRGCEGGKGGMKDRNNGMKDRRAV